MSLFKWFSGKPAPEDPLKIINLLDEDKPLYKRYSQLISYIQRLLKLSNEKFNPRLFDFFKEHNDLVTSLCFAHLNQTDSKLKIKSWGEVADSITALIELTRYGQVKRQDAIQNLSKVCLQDGNRVELRQLGLSLIMNLISHKEMLHIPFEIFQAAIDLSHFTTDQSIQLANRQSLSYNEEPKWLANVKEYLARISPNSSSKQLTKLAAMVTNNEMVKEMLILFKDLLEFTLEGGVTATGINVLDHFKKWLGILKRSYLLLLYPDLVDEAYNKGFPRCPEVLHFLIVSWINKFVTIPEINCYVFNSQVESGFTLRILEKSFLWLQSDSLISKKSAIRSQRIIMNWLKNKNLPVLKHMTLDDFILNSLSYTICVFNYKTDTSKNRVELCNKEIELLNAYQESFQNAIKLYKSLLQICDILEHQQKVQEIFEGMSFFLLKLFTTANWQNYKILREFNPYLHSWCSTYSSIIQQWKKNFLDMLVAYPIEDFENPEKIANSMEYFKILGNSLEFYQNSQIEWASALHEILLNLLDKGLSPVLLIRYFLNDFSKLVLKASKDAQIISLNSICLLFTEGSYEIPSVMMAQHLFYLIAVSIKKDFLTETILRHSAKLLDYKGIHVIIGDLVELSNGNRPEGLSAIFRIFCLPNLYKQTVLLNLDGNKSDYFSLKKKIFKFFLEFIEERPSPNTLDGFTVFLVEEVANDYYELVEEGLNVLLNLANHMENSIAMNAISNISILVPIIPRYHNKILEFIVKKTIKPKKFDKEQLMISIFDLTTCILLNSRSPLDDESLKILFQRIAKFGTVNSKDSKLQIYMDLFLSFLSFFHLNFPLKDTTVEIIDSQLKDSQYDDTVEHYSLYGYAVLSLYSNKILIRNEFGKFLWTCSNFKIFNSENYSEDQEKLMHTLEHSKVSLPIQAPPISLPNAPTLELLIDFITKTYSVCSSTHLKVEPSENKNVSAFIANRENQIKQLEKPDCSKEIKNLSKVFLANFGLLNDLDALETGEKLERSLNLLDAIKSREQAKIGVLFVGAGHDDEKAILANDSCSEGFLKFLSKIGKPVELASYSANLGGLDPKGSCGALSVAYTDWEFDVMFHVPVLMPTDANDKQQVLKKRHVGNDHVMVIWSENWKNYRPDTIVTHFNFVNIIIYPIEKELYRIQIQNKLNVTFGPLKDGMVISWKILPYLIRSTALSANRALKLHKHPGYEKQTMIRYKTIKDIARECSLAMNSTAKKFMTARV